jgi:drug/metabolite transporter (DMT)-like permease
MSLKKIYLALGFGILCLSSSSILTRHLNMRGVPLLGVACYRMIIVAILLGLPALLLRRGEVAGLGRSRLLLLIIGGIFLALHFGTWTASLEYIPVGRSVLLVTCHPIFTVLASRLFLGDRISSRNLIAVLVAFVGIVIIFSESLSGRAVAGGNSLLLGDLLALAGAVTVVGYIIIGKHLRTEVSLLAYTSVLYAVCALMLVPAALAAGVRPGQLVGEDYLWLLALAVVPTLGGHTVFNYLLKDVSATLISTAFLGEPLGASLLAWLVWGQIPSIATLAGGAFVLAGIYLLRVEREPQRHKDHKEEEILNSL